MSIQDHGIEDREIELASGEPGSLSDNELAAACGGLKWIDIHMPYKDFIRWPGGSPSPTRIC